MTNLKLLRSVSGSFMSPGGHHLEKFPTPPKIVAPTYPSGCRVFDKRRNFNGEVIPGNLPWERYRYWIGKRHQSIGYAKCRVCGLVIENYITLKERMLDHENHSTCMMIATLAYQSLSKINMCGVCGKDTWVDFWGVYLHRDTCRELWQFMSDVSIHMRRAYNIAQMELDRSVTL